jgi:ElaB/YqjD/DUF883 family membrane-anchored ribosome-binding protein
MMKSERDIVDNSPMAAGEGFSEPHDDAGFREDVRGTTETTREEAMGRAQEFAAEARDHAESAGQEVQERTDAGIDRAAQGMESAADTLREKAAGKEGLTAEAGTKLADGMERTAGYLKEHDTAAILDDMETYVREHPMQALAGAVVGGFLIGRLLH